VEGRENRPDKRQYCIVTTHYCIELKVKTEVRIDIGDIFTLLNLREALADLLQSETRSRLEI
jgi:hypothetical protein